MSKQGELNALADRVESGTLEMGRHDFNVWLSHNTVEDYEGHPLDLFDAASLLHEDVAPDWKVSHAFWDNERAVFNLTHKTIPHKYAGGEGKEPPQAYTVAILRALASLEDE